MPSPYINLRHTHTHTHVQKNNLPSYTPTLCALAVLNICLCRSGRFPTARRAAAAVPPLWLADDDATEARLADLASDFADINIYFTS